MLLGGIYAALVLTLSSTYGAIRCAENRAACYDCVTGMEWIQGIKDYYANGGGVSFDFTVAEETKVRY